MTRAINRIAATVFGAVYVVVGAAGFTVTRLEGFAETQGPLLGVLQVNPLHNFVHLGIGVALLVGAAVGPLAARTVNVVVGGVYLLVGILGVFLVGSEANVLALNHPDNALHLVTAVVLFGLGVFADVPAAAAPPAVEAEAREWTEPEAEIPVAVSEPETEAESTIPEPEPVEAATVAMRAQDWEEAESPWDETTDAYAAGWEEVEWEDEEAEPEAAEELFEPEPLDEAAEALYAEPEEAAVSSEAAVTTSDTEDLASMTKGELYKRAQQLDVEGRSSMSKEQLVDALQALR